MRVLMCIATLVAGVAAPVSAATIENGQMDGDVAFRELPDGWLAPDIEIDADFGTGCGVPGVGEIVCPEVRNAPDTSGTGTGQNVGGFTVGDPAKPIPFAFDPTNGNTLADTYVGLGFQQSVKAVEGIAQHVDGFIVGDSYTLSWDFGNFGALVSEVLSQFADAVSPGRIGVYLGTQDPGDDKVLLSNLDKLYETELLSTGPDWRQESFTFEAEYEAAYLYFVGTFDWSSTADSVGYLALDDIELSRVPLPAGVWLMLSGLAGLGVMRRFRAT